MAANKNTVLTLGLIIYDSVSLSLQIVSTAGTTGNGAQPTFSATAGVTTADNTVTWTSLGLASGFAVWAAPFARMQSAVAANWMTIGQSLFIGDDHAETQAASMTITSPGTLASPVNFYSIDHTGAVTLAAGTLKTGAAATTTSTSNLTLNGIGLYVFGLALTAASGANTNNLILGSTSTGSLVLDSCTLRKASTTGNSCAIGQANASEVVLVNTTWQFGAVGDSLSVVGNLTWKATASAIAGATIPTSLFTGNTNGLVVIDGVDLSALATQTVIAAAANTGHFLLNNCKLASGTVISGTPTSPACQIDAICCDSAGTRYQKYRNRYAGILIPETTIIRTGGASDGTTGTSDKITTTANSKWTFPFLSIPIVQWNTVITTNRIVTLYGIWNAAALPNNDDIWAVAEYFGASTSPLSSFATGTKANNLATGTPLTADSASAWSSLVTARANTTAYVIGDVRKVASNANRIFFCTTAGTSAGSEPVGYSTAVDGGSVTDNTAVFRAGTRFTLTVTLSSPQPAMTGPLYVVVNAAKISSTFWVDPKVYFS